MIAITVVNAERDCVLHVLLFLEIAKRIKMDHRRLRTAL